MHNKTELSLGRIDRFIREWIEPNVIEESKPLHVSSWEAPGEPVAFADAISGTYASHELGQKWGAPWGTTWFHVVGSVPSGWPKEGTRAEIAVNLGWIVQQPGFQAEGAAWDIDGHLVKGISPRNHFVPIAPVTKGSQIDFYIEGASNPDVPGDAWTKPTRMGAKETAGNDHLYVLEQMDLVLVNLEMEALLADARTIRGLVGVLSPDTPRYAKLLAALEEMCDAIDPDNVVATAISGRNALNDVLASPAAASAHEVYAVGHAHIDSAWLWPTRETERKVGRTVGNVLALMDENPNFTYAFSSAQQYAWIKTNYPDLFERLKARIAEGRITPVGGMWVESDTNMPSGEALARQFVAGKSFFSTEFNIDTSSVWLPDSFGYTGAIPQIAHLAGCNDFLTQKLSWNDTNKMPHSTFWWEGIDGTRVFTHFPPVDTYNSNLSAEELDRASRNFKDKAHANKSLAPFGYGDGGGGPTREMILQGQRTTNLEGSPKVVFATPNQFFEDARNEYADHAPTWVGEMYLEYHRGTYTSQQRTKRGNRHCEALLHEAETWATLASIRTGSEYPKSALQDAWETVLLQQFHDILPGSSIAWVHRDAERNYAEVAETLEHIISRSLADLGAGTGPTQTLWANSAPTPNLGVPGYTIAERRPSVGTSLTHSDGKWTLANNCLTATIDDRGVVLSLMDTKNNRELVPPNRVGNLLQIFRDIPNNWEAWDIEEHYRRVGQDLTNADRVEEATGPEGQPAIRVERTFGSSHVEQLLWVANDNDPTLHIRTEVDWYETQKLLKLAFPLNLVSNDAQAEMQFGFVTRPTHDNTTWDAAKFETVAHRWLRVGEPNYSVSLSNNTTYGFDVTRERVNDYPTTLVRASLLRAPLFPDPVADQGEHSFHHALTLDAAITDAYAHGYELNHALRPVSVAESAETNLYPAVQVEGDAIVETIKLAEDGSGDVILRLYEPTGNYSDSKLRIGFQYQSIEVVNILETDAYPESLDHQALEPGTDEARVRLHPFQVLTLRVKR